MWLTPDLRSAVSSLLRLSQRPASCVGTGQLSIIARAQCHSAGRTSPRRAVTGSVGDAAEGPWPQVPPWSKALCRGLVLHPPLWSLDLNSLSGLTLPFPEDFAGTAPER